MELLRRGGEGVIAGRAIALVLCIALGACRDSTAPRIVSGSWTGSTLVAEQAFQVTADLMDAGGSVTGTGGVLSAGIQCAASIAGSRTGSAVSLTFTCAGYSPFTFVADLSRNGRTLAGHLNGSGFNDDVLNLNKQD